MLFGAGHRRRPTPQHVQVKKLDGPSRCSEHPAQPPWVVEKQSSARYPQRAAAAAPSASSHSRRDDPIGQWPRRTRSPAHSLRGRDRQRPSRKVAPLDNLPQQRRELADRIVVQLFTQRGVPREMQTRNRLRKSSRCVVVPAKQRLEEKPRSFVESPKVENPARALQRAGASPPALRSMTAPSRASSGIEVVIKCALLRSATHPGCPGAPICVISLGSEQACRAASSISVRRTAGSSTMRVTAAPPELTDRRRSVAPLLCQPEPAVNHRTKPSERTAGSQESLVTPTGRSLPAADRHPNGELKTTFRR